MYKDKLPAAFVSRMKQLLGDEYTEFEASYEEPRKYGLRVNTLKITPEQFCERAPFHLTPISWIPGAYTYLEEDQAARHPYYAAGLYYLQEPSAMTPASVLDVSPGDTVLDLCAAPGGKATALAAALQGEGLLVANDISASRAKALLKNLELFGVRGAFVTNEVPAKLAERFPGFFDKILVDAPCSGEGMFRKDEAVIRAWDPDKPARCAAIQKDILGRAVQMLREGGTLLYSTCTFAPEENEEVIRDLLTRQEDMVLEPIPMREGFTPGFGGIGVRLWPHRTGGEGHYLALLKKKPDGSVRYCSSRISRTSGPSARSGPQTDLVEAFCRETGITDTGLLPSPGEKLEIRRDQVYLIREIGVDVKGIPFLRNGLYMGEIKKDRFEPSQSLAMALVNTEGIRRLPLRQDDPRIERYLRGETLQLTGEESTGGNGWILVCVEEYPLGWGKLNGQLLKNKYHPGWRIRW